LVVDRQKQCFVDNHFSDLAGLLDSGDLIVRNTSSVLPCRVELIRASGNKVEAIMAPIAELSDERVELAKRDFGQAEVSAWSVLARNLKVGGRLTLGKLTALVAGRFADRSALVVFNGSRSAVEQEFGRVGQMPLPPYILNRRGQDKNWQGDRQRYQTVFAKQAGSIAAPTAGLHFTDEIFQELADKGVEISDVTLHVGRGTFQPIESADIRNHHMAEEFYNVPESTQNDIARVRHAGKRVIGVGTTVVRTLESWRRLHAAEGSSEIFLYPGEEVDSIDGLITNFHLPGSSLLLLVMAFAGEELVRRAYQHAVDEGYRFYSYGDAMLIL
jgi:S-adenosylmethionine:tRNA ribosyltransferase-isomerase